MWWGFKIPLCRHCEIKKDSYSVDTVKLGKTLKSKNCERIHFW